MAEIYLARSMGIEGFEKYVVVKRILRENLTDRRYVDMFLDEARLAASLHHQNIAQVYDIGREGEDYFFAMEYLHGVDLRTLANRLLSRGLGFPLPHVLTVIAGTCAGLHYAHEVRAPGGDLLNLVHRDVSPSNIVVTYDGAVKLVDFGVARADHDDRRHKTRSGSLKGKIAYMSPEQCLGEDLDRRSDVFALGIVLFELSTMSRLFRVEDRSDYKVMEAIVNGATPRPSERDPDYPPDLERIVLKCLAKNPDDRYRDARSLQGDLERFAAQMGIPLSTAALSEFVENTLGRPPEPWVELEAMGTLPPARLDNTVSYVDLTQSQDGPVRAPTDPGARYDLAAGVPVYGDRLPTQRDPVQGSTGSWRWVGVVAVAVLALAGISIAAAIRGDDTSPEPSLALSRTPAPAEPSTGVVTTPQPTTPQAEVAKADAAPEVPVPDPVPDEMVVDPDPLELVAVRFEGTPPTAQITVDGLEVNEATTELVKDGLAHQVVVQAEGFYPQVLSVISDEAKTIRYELQPISKAVSAKPTKPATTERPSKSRSQRKKIDVSGLRDLTWD